MNISVVIPAYNAAHLLDNLASSLRNQTIDQDRFETILVDDGSTDDTYELGRSLGFRLIRMGENSGPAKARNAGIKAAKGDIVVFTDADCSPLENWLEEMTTPLADSHISGVQGIYKTTQKKLTARFIQYEIEERYNKMRKRINIDFIGTYSAAYRKKDLFEIGLFDATYRIASGEDTDLSYRLHKNNKKLVLNDNAVVYHMHPDTLSKYFRQKFGRGFWGVRLYGRSPQKAFSDDFTPQYLKMQVALIYPTLASTFSIPLLPPLFLPATAAYISLIALLSVPSAIQISKQDLSVGLFTPWYHLIRALALASGFLKGALIHGMGEVRRYVQNRFSELDG